LVEKRIGDLPRFDRGAALHFTNEPESSHDLEKMEKLKTECNKNNAASCDVFISALCWSKDIDDCKQDLSKNMVFLEKGCALGLGMACLDLAEALKASDSATAHASEIVSLQRKGEALLDQSCKEKKDGRACGLLGFHLWSNPTNSNGELVVSYFILGCEVGNSGACFNAASWFVLSGSAPKSGESVFKYTEKACFAADPVPDGCSMLGRLYESGKMPEMPEDIAYQVPISFSRAVQFYSRACKLKDGEGCAYLGRLYQDGRGVKQSWNKALSFYKAGCDFKSGWSCSNAAWLLSQPQVEKHLCFPGEAKNGECSLTNHNIKQSPDKAAEFYSRACQLKYADGCNMLGIYFNNGFGVTKSTELAKQYFQQSENLRKRKPAATNNSKSSEGSAPSLIKKTVSFFYRLINGD